MALNKITTFSKPVSALDDRPTIPAIELKAWFDSNTTTEVKTAFNDLIDALVASTGSDEIGAAEIVDLIGGVPEGTIKDQLVYIATYLNTHAVNVSNPHSVTKAQVGLGNANNTSDANKPISTATQTALDLKANTTDMETALGGKVDKVTGKGLSTNDYDDTEKSKVLNAASLAQLNAHTTNIFNPHNVTKAQLGLGNVDNTDDYNKPISTETQTALDLKVDKVTGKGLSSNDFTTTYKTALDDLPITYATITSLEDKADKENVDGGFSAGTGATASAGGAIGAGSVAGYGGGAIGTNAITDYGGAVGEFAYSEAGGAVGKGSITSQGFAGGFNAKAENEGSAIDAIQLGTGTNNEPLTLQVYDTKIVNADGTLTQVEEERTFDLLTSTTPSITITTRKEYRYSNALTALTLAAATDPNDGTVHESVIKFKTGASGFTPTISASNCLFKGDGCTGGAWTTVSANKYYELHGTWILDKLVWVVSSI